MHVVGLACGLAGTLVLCGGRPVGAQPSVLPDTLTYDARPNSPVPIPRSELGLPTAVAETWFKVTDAGVPLEGAAFDRSGDLHFVDAASGTVFRVTPDRRLAVILPPSEQQLGGLAIHRDGRIFAARTGQGFRGGSVVALQPDGSGLQTIVARDAGFVVNDLVFDAAGGFYFTDFRGTSTEPKGGVYYVAPDFKSVRPVLSNLALANGIALSPDGKVLWITEFGRNLLHRVELADAITPTPFGTTVPYSFVGPAPDSMRVDADGNVYVAMYGQGRVLAFNRNGFPIGQVLLPGRDEGHNLLSTSLALKPDTNELYIVTNDGDGGRGSTIFRARGFAQASTLFSHR